MTKAEGNKSKSTNPDASSAPNNSHSNQPKHKKHLWGRIRRFVLVKPKGKKQKSGEGGEANPTSLNIQPQFEGQDTSRGSVVEKGAPSIFVDQGGKSKQEQDDLQSKYSFVSFKGMRAARTFSAKWKRPAKNDKQTSRDIGNCSSEEPPNSPSITAKEPKFGSQLSSIHDLKESVCNRTTMFNKDTMTTSPMSHVSFRDTKDIRGDEGEDYEVRSLGRNFNIRSGETRKAKDAHATFLFAPKAQSRNEDNNVEVLSLPPDALPTQDQNEKSGEIRDSSDEKGLDQSDLSGRVEQEKLDEQNLQIPSKQSIRLSLWQRRHSFMVPKLRNGRPSGGLNKLGIDKLMRRTSSLPKHIGRIGEESQERGKRTKEESDLIGSELDSPWGVKATGSDSSGSGASRVFRIGGLVSSRKQRKSNRKTSESFSDEGSAEDEEESQGTKPIDMFRDEFVDYTIKSMQKKERKR